MNTWLTFSEMRAKGACKIVFCVPAYTHTIHHVLVVHENSKFERRNEQLPSFEIFRLLLKISNRMMQRVSLVAMQGLRTTSRALFSSNSRGFAGFYHIEASNAANPDLTQLTVSGPDVDGILASMTVSLALQGCSLVELHATKNEPGISHNMNSSSQIKDTFLVVNRVTGKQFDDTELESLAKCLLESLQTPMNTLSRTTAEGELKEMEESLEIFDDVEDQITVIRSTD